MYEITSELLPHKKRTMYAALLARLFVEERVEARNAMEPSRMDEDGGKMKRSEKQQTRETKPSISVRN